MKLIIQGRPVPAVRMTQRSKYKNQQAQRYLAYKEQIGWEAKAAKLERLQDYNVHIEIKCYFCGGKECDVDNLAKSMLDGLNGVAYDDDRQVQKLTVQKLFVDFKQEERAEIEITEVAG